MMSTQKAYETSQLRSYLSSFRIAPILLNTFCTQQRHCLRFRTGLLRLRPPQVRDGLPRHGLPRVRRRGHPLPRADRRPRRPEPPAPPPDLPPPVLRGAARAGLEAGPPGALGLRGVAVSPAEPAAALPRRQPRPHREPQPPPAPAAPPEHARARALRRFDVLRADDGRQQ